MRFHNIFLFIALDEALIDLSPLLVSSFSWSIFLVLFLLPCLGRRTSLHVLSLSLGVQIRWHGWAGYLPVGALTDRGINSKVVNSSFPLSPNSYAYPCLAVDSQSIPSIPAGLFHETSSDARCWTLWDGGRRPLIRFDSLLGMQIALASSASSPPPSFLPSSLPPSSPDSHARKRRKHRARGYMESQSS